MRKLKATALVCFLFVDCIPSARAFNEPPVNLGLTSLLDGGPVLPGLYFAEYAVAANSDRPSDKDGNEISGGARIAAVSNTHQLVYMSPLHFAGGAPGITVVQPVVGITAQGNLGPGPVTANTAGLGDIVIGPMLQWNGGSLWGRPYFQRAEVDTVFPTGKYDKKFSANPGSNLWTFEPYYGFTWLFAESWETSWRLIYTFNGNNPDTQVRPGQMFHGNYAVSYGVAPKLRLGALGYFLVEINDDRVAGARVPDSRERALALGPAVAYLGSGLAIFLSHPLPLVTINRFRTSQTTLQMVYKF